MRYTMAFFGFLSRRMPRIPRLRLHGMGLTILDGSGGLYGVGLTMLGGLGCLGWVVWVIGVGMN